MVPPFIVLLKLKGIVIRISGIHIIVLLYTSSELAFENTQVPIVTYCRLLHLSVTKLGNRKDPLII